MTSMTLMKVRTVLTRLGGAAALAAAMLMASSCGTSRSTLTPDQVGLLTDSTLLFRDRLAVGGSGFFSFLVSQKQAVSVTYASAMVGETGPAVPTPLSLGLGQPSGADCALPTPAVLVAPALTAQIAQELEPGTYCVRVADPGSLSSSIDFAVRVVLSFGAPSRAAAGAETLSTSLAVGGASMRTVTASETGTLTLALQSLGDGASAVGVGVGIPRLSGSGCYLTQSVVTGPGAGPHLSIPVSPGTYCTGVFDTGTLTKPVTFSLRITFP